MTLPSRSPRRRGAAILTFFVFILPGSAGSSTILASDSSKSAIAQDEPLTSEGTLPDATVDDFPAAGEEQQGMGEEPLPDEPSAADPATEKSPTAAKGAPPTTKKSGKPEKSAVSEAPKKLTVTKEVIRKVQTALRARGAKITPDGTIGSQTIHELKRFQKENKLPPTGRIDMATLTKLGIRF